MAYIIVDLDGTLVLEDDKPNQPLIDATNALVMAGESQLHVVSARSIDRLEESRAWLQEYGVAGVEEVYLNDLEGTPFETGLKFKTDHVAKMVEDGAEITFAIDNDADVRAAYDALGVKAFTWQEVVAAKISQDKPAEDAPAPDATAPVAAVDDYTNYSNHAEKTGTRVSVKVPGYISDAAAQGLEFYAQGLAGDGLQPETVTEAKQLAAGTVDDDKVQRLAAWVARHRSDWEGVAQNSDPSHPDWPGAGAVAGLLWGVPVSEAGAADRVTDWANDVVESIEGDDMPTRTDRREFETRGIPVGDYTLADTEDGQRTVTFYSALFDQPSQGLPFTESIAPGAFKRAIGQAAQGRRIVKLLHNHDEGRMLASTASGRMVLEEDQRGLKVTAQVDPYDPDGAKIISLLKREAAAMSASFGFYIPKGGDSWDSDGNRRITEASLVECSLLSGATAAYPSTQGLATVRKVAAQKIGIDADTLMNTFERVKAGQLLSEDDAKVLETVRQKLGPKPARVIHPSVAEAQLKLQRLNSENQ